MLPTRTTDRRGLTLLEVTVSLAILGVLLIPALYSLGSVARSERISARHEHGTHLARQLIAEIVQGCYAEPDAEPVFGREFEGSANRDGWDDVDDYHGWTATPPQAKDGTPLDEFAGWTRQVGVTHANPVTLVPAGTASDIGLKRIVVIVTAPTGEVTELQALRSRNSSYEQAPALDTEYLTWIGVELRTTGGGAAMTNGVALRNPISLGSVTP